MAVEVQLISFSNVAKRLLQFICHLVGTITSVISIMCKNVPVSQVWSTQPHVWGQPDFAARH